jgi:DNA-binding transcriptional regulator/RsmH inhibitor MraZ
MLSKDRGFSITVHRHVMSKGRLFIPNQFVQKFSSIVVETKVMLLYQRIPLLEHFQNHLNQIQTLTKKLPENKTTYAFLISLDYGRFYRYTCPWT